MLKKLVLLVALSILLSSCSNHAEIFSGGTGTAKDPYIIKTKDDFITLINNTEKDNYNDKLSKSHYKQVNDIDLKNCEEWNTFGCNNKDIQKYGFSGIYDGNGYKISNLMIAPSKNDSCKKESEVMVDRAYGLFPVIKGYKKEKTKIKNLTLNNITIKFDSDSQTVDAVGAICGFVNSNDSNDVIIDNCSGANIKIQTNVDYAGMFIGLNSGTVKNSSIAGSIIIDQMSDRGVIGGFIGINDGIIVDSESKSDIFLHDMEKYIPDGSEITNNMPNINSSNTNLYAYQIGGFVGENGLNNNLARIDNSKAAGVVIIDSTKGQLSKEDIEYLSSYINSFVNENNGYVNESSSGMTVKGIKSELEFGT